MYILIINKKKRYSKENNFEKKTFFDRVPCSDCSGFVFVFRPDVSIIKTLSMEKVNFISVCAHFATLLIF